MHSDTQLAQLDNWISVCQLDEIVPNTGVCALINGAQVALFHVINSEERVFAISNFDPHSQASILSRGMVGNLGERIVVASPMYKQHFDLQTGECLEFPEHSVSAYPTRVVDGKVWVGV